MNISRIFLRPQFLNFVRSVHGAKCKIKPGPKVRPAFHKLKANQKRFQVDDGNPVWLKAGLRDTILYQFTVASLLVATLWSLKVIWDLSFGQAVFSRPKPPKEPEDLECCKQEDEECEEKCGEKPS